MAQISYPAGMHRHVLRPGANDQGIPGNYGVNDYLYPTEQVESGTVWFAPDAELPAVGSRLQIDRLHATVIAIGSPSRIRIAEHGVPAIGVPVHVGEAEFV